MEPVFITIEQLKAIVPGLPKNADVFISYLNVWMNKYEINTPERIQMFIAQVAHESGGFKYTRELWGPTNTQKLYERDFKQPWKAGLGKEDRNHKAYELGNSEPGDGVLFKGRGLIQTTGRSNYAICSKDLFGDDTLLKSPQLLETSQYAVASACLYWHKKGLNAICDQQDSFTHPWREQMLNKYQWLTVNINGGLTHYDERLAYLEKAKQELV